MVDEASCLNQGFWEQNLSPGQSSPTSSLSLGQGCYSLGWGIHVAFLLGGCR